jgi:protoporphyrin/coproporphyrin ferrochelatase
MSRKGVLLVNLGSPDSPSVRDVRRYLRQFLMDGRVMDLSYVPRFLLVHGCILPFRPKESAEAYHKIWWKEGSPLVVITRRVGEQLRERLGLPVEISMRYQNPSISEAVQRLESRGVEELVIVPLFPHYAMSSYETAVEEAKKVLAKSGVKRWSVVPPFYEDPEYIAALVGSASEYLRGEYDHLLFSFHGLPERHLRKSDPTGRHCLATPDCCASPSPARATCYRAQCFRTVEAFVEKAGVTKYSVAFQSRLGKDPWLRPYTDHEIVRLAQDGVRRMLVICPAFVSDCLETIEEIGMRGKEMFVGAGGLSFDLIPCLNEHPLWLAALARLANRGFADLGSETAQRSRHELDTKPNLDSEARVV